MKISRNSWHFRFLSYVNPSKALDISFDVRHGKYYSECRYFWLILWTLVSRGIMTVCCVWFLLGLLMGMLVGPYHIFLAYLSQSKIELGMFEAIGLGMWILIAFAIVQGAVKSLYRFLIKRSNAKSKTYDEEFKTDGMIKSFIKSKKEKVCKKIEFVD